MGGATGIGGTSGTGGSLAGAQPAVTGISVSNGYGTGYGFQGYWAAIATEESTVSPECPSPCLSESGGAVCVSGTVGLNRQLDTVGLFWTLNQGVDASPADEGDPADMSAYSTIVIDVQVNSSEPLDLHLALRHWPDDYCIPIEPGTNRVSVWDMQASCWGGAFLTPDVLDEVTLLTVRVSSAYGATTPTPLDICITHLSFE
jgi:hypothetical protein